VEEALRFAHEQGWRRQHRGLGGREYLPQRALRQARSPSAPGGPDDRHRLAGQHLVRARSREPVNGVLQHPGDRPVVLGRCDQERVRGRDLIAEMSYGLRPAAGGALQVLVEEWDRAQGVVDAEPHPRRSTLGRGLEQPSVERAAAQAAGDPEDAPHRHAGILAGRMGHACDPDSPPPRRPDPVCDSGLCQPADKHRLLAILQRTTGAGART
jgi:hypothetical protein